MQTAPAPYRFSHHTADGLAVYVDEPEVMHRIPVAPVALTLTQRVRRIPNISGGLYCYIMRAPGDLRTANRLSAFNGGREQRRDAMRHMAHAINALRRAEKVAGLSSMGAVA